MSILVLCSNRFSVLRTWTITILPAVASAMAVATAAQEPAAAVASAGVQVCCSASSFGPGGARRTRSLADPGCSGRCGRPMPRPVVLPKFRGPSASAASVRM